MSRVSRPIFDGDPIIRYLCALVAELAYHHVPAFEIDHKKRAKIIPCKHYAEIITAGTPTNVIPYLQELEVKKAFVVVDRGIIAIGIPINEMLFVGFRGTMFLFDWKINLKAPLVEVNSCIRFRRPFVNEVVGWGGGRVHRGFAEEAVRISARLMDSIRDMEIDNVNHIFLSGHSLGGAVAALSENFFPRGVTSTCMFGSPRYCDTSAHYCSPDGPPAQIQRPGDIVPLMPPRWMGYADHPYHFDTSGKPIIGPIRFSGWPYFVWRAALFLGKGFEPHNMEAYRQELGSAAATSHWAEPLAPYEELTIAETR